MPRPNSPLISIIIPVFNMARSLEKALQSVLEQDYQNIELIIIDGGSSDGGVEIIKRYHEKIAFWVSEKDQGVYDAMNKGIKHARGDWFYFLGADDILVNNLHNLVKQFRNANTVYYGDVYWKSKNRIYDGHFSVDKIINRNICHQSMFYPKKVFSIYKYDLNYKIFSDYDLNLKLFADNRFRFKYVSKLISIFDGNGLSSNFKDIPFKQDKPGLIKKLKSKCLIERLTLRNVLNKIRRGISNRFLQ